MRFRSYHSLRFFDVVARHMSISAAAQEINQSKGSVSYQISKLEYELGFKLFERAHARLALTEEGRRLWHVSEGALRQIDREIDELRGGSSETVIVGALTYFSSRWLSQRLMRFFEVHPGISLRIEPLSSIQNLRSVSVDLAILWGIGEWSDVRHELLLPCPAVPTANANMSENIREMGLSHALRTLPLLGDSSGETGWKAWHETAGLQYQPSRSSLVIPDSNSRVQAVIDGQGLALWDDLVAPEFNTGTLVKVSEIILEGSGYYVVFPKPFLSKAASVFLDWLKFEAAPE